MDTRAPILPTLRVALLLAVANSAPIAAGELRIFGDGFEPCCRLGGTVHGLSGGGLVLGLDAGPLHESYPVGPPAATLDYRFVHSVASGISWSVAVEAQPAGQSCAVTHDNGVVADTAIDDIDVHCVAAGGLLWDEGDWGDGWN